MTEQISKVQRWLDLVAYLVGRRVPVTVEELMERVPAYARKWEGGADTDRATARRTFERDKDELRELGIPLETVSYTVNFGSERIEGYRLSSRDFYLPYLRLVREGASGGEGEGADEDDEKSEARGAARDRRISEVELDEEEATLAADALHGVAENPGFPLRREARSALRKLTFDLADRELPRTPVLYPEDPDAAEVTARLRVLTDALLARKRVGFRYHGIYRGAATDRDVAPYGLFLQGGHWYMVGSDASRDGELRVFRADRMESVEPETRRPATPDYTIPDDFRVADFLDREAWELGGPEERGTDADRSPDGGRRPDRGEEETPLEARVLFRFPASLRVDRQGRGRLVEERDDGAAVRDFRVRQPGPFVRWLLTFRGEARILSPPELRASMEEMARSVAALYGDGVEEVP
ncbi:MAG: helix-turn-helix transcriptional regulator [Gemmatimonadota bacterium]